MSQFNEKERSNFDKFTVSQEIEDYTQHIEERTKERRKRELSRRTLIATGWVVPIVMSVSLAKPARASGGITHPGKGLGKKGNSGQGVGVGNSHPVHQGVPGNKKPKK